MDKIHRSVLCLTVSEWAGKGSALPTVKNGLRTRAYVRKH